MHSPEQQSALSEHPTVSAVQLAVAGGGVAAAAGGDWPSAFLQRKRRGRGEAGGRHGTAVQSASSAGCIMAAHCSSTHMHMLLMGSQMLLQQSPSLAQSLPTSKQRAVGG